MTLSAQTKRFLTANAVGLILVIALGIEARSALGAKPPQVLTLSGQRFAGTPTITSSSCHAEGPSSFTYVATGIADEPYHGSFTEVGRVTAVGQFDVQATSYEATFVILPDPDDPNPTFERIVGTRTLDLMSGSVVRCDAVFEPLFNLYQLNTSSLYEATIFTSDGRRCLDSGRADVQLFSTSVRDEPGTVASYASSFGPPPFAGDRARCRGRSHI
jgi:hypothetical protein